MAVQSDWVMAVGGAPRLEMSANHYQAYTETMETLEV